MFIWGVAGLVTMAKSPHAVVTKRQTQPQPWLIHDWMEEKGPDLPQELCSPELCSLLWVSFPLLSFYPVLREAYKRPYNLVPSCFPTMATSDKRAKEIGQAGGLASTALPFMPEPCSGD